MATFVLALEEAAARTSANSAESAALRPKAVRASVTISDVVARSSPEAAARFMMPSIPFSMSSVFHPAIAIYFMASAASDAENLVFAPISFALSDSFCSSVPVEPETAETFAIASSKEAPVSTMFFPAAAATPATAASRAVSFAPAEDILPPMEPSTSPRPVHLALSASMASAAFFMDF